jgi:hypothetical protein
MAELLQVLISVQLDASSVLAKVYELETEKHALEQKMLEIEKWAETEKKYELKEIAPGVLAYAYKTADDPSKPKHWLCPACYTKQKASILQRNGFSPDGAKYVCLLCGAEVIDSTDKPQSLVDFRPQRG